MVANTLFIALSVSTVPIILKLKPSSRVIPGYLMLWKNIASPSMVRGRQLVTATI